jgi:large subunit ribosomal protein L10
MPSFINDLSLKEVKALVSGSPSVIVLDPSRLNSSDSLALRKSLNGAGAKMKVAKVNLIKLALPEAAAKLLEGKTTIALVTAKDMLAAAKIVIDLEKAEKIKVRGGIMDGAILDNASVKKLASMPSKQTLYGMLVNILAAPITGLARVIAEIEKKKKAAG